MAKRPFQFHLSTALIATLVIAVLVGFICWEFDLAHDGAEELPWTHGLTLGQLEQKLGRPDQTSEFSSKDSVSEFRGPIRNFYGPDDAAVPIREVWWKFHTHTKTIWFRKEGADWVAFHSCRWQKDGQF